MHSTADRTPPGQRAGLAALFAGVLAAVAFADAASIIARIERLPRSQRLTACESALADGSAAASERSAIIQAFARHAYRVSPLYSRSAFPFDRQRWAALLRESFDPQKPDINVALARSQLLVDANDWVAAGPVHVCRDLRPVVVGFFDRRLKSKP